MKHEQPIHKRKGTGHRNGLIVLITSLLLIAMAGVVYAAAPGNWLPGSQQVGVLTDCTGSSANSDNASHTDNAVKCQEYNNDGTVWDLYETLDYTASAGVAETADIEEVTYYFDATHLFIQWDHVDGWNSVNESNTHKHYVEIDTQGNLQGDYYVGFEPDPADLCPGGNQSCTTSDDWVSAATAQNLDKEFSDSNNDIGGANLTMSDNGGTTGDGYEADHFAAADDIYVRAVNGDLQMAIKWSYLGESGGPDTNFCVRIWSSQESTLSNDKLYWHDQNTSSDLSSAKMDNVFWACFTPTAVTLDDLGVAPVSTAALPLTATLIAVLAGASWFLVKRKRTV